MKNVMKDAKRGDTIIEVMFALAIFGFAAILSIGAMNRGMTSAETTLELSTARNEMNAQAEVLRFAHASYNAGGSNLWKKLTENAKGANDLPEGIQDLSNYILTPDENDESDTVGCKKMYTKIGDGTPLQKVNAFVINTRKFDVNNLTDTSDEYFSIGMNKDAFRESQLSARIIYFGDGGLSDKGKFEGTGDTEIVSVEGMWVYAVKSEQSNTKNGETFPNYYDFYIDACWYGPGAITPTIIDTVIRLYNPEAM